MRKLIRKISIYFLASGLWFILSAKASLAETSFTKFLPKLGEGPLDPATIQDLGGLINYLFQLGFWIVGLSIFIMFMWAGLEWFLAGPNLTKVQSAKTKMSNAILGFVLLLSAWLILNVINPDLVRNTTTLPGIK